MADAATDAESATMRREDRIGVLEELLATRYSCRAFLPRPVPRATIEHMLDGGAEDRVVVQQPALAGGDRVAARRQGSSATLMYGGRFRRRPNDRRFPFPREYLGVYLERRRESGFQLYNSLGIPRGDKAAYAKQALENFNFFGAPHVAIVHTDEALGVYGAIDCGGYVTSFMLAAQALGLGHHPAGGAGVSFRGGAPAISGSATTAAWSAAFPSDSRPRAQGQQLPHHARQRRRHRHLRRRIADGNENPDR